MPESRHVRWLTAACFLLALAAHATGLFQAHGKVPHKHDTRAEVEAVDRKWRDAISTNDIPSMEKLLSEDYLGISANGQVLTRAQQLDRMRSRETAITKMEMTDEKIKLIGTIAIVTSSANLDGIFDSHPIHGLFRSTRVYKRTGGVWQITSFEATPLRSLDHD